MSLLPVPWAVLPEHGWWTYADPCQHCGQSESVRGCFSPYTLHEYSFCQLCATLEPQSPPYTGREE